MITTANSLLRRSGMPIHWGGVLVHAMPDTELSRVRTELDPLSIFPTVPPHPVHPNRESSGHGHLGDVPLSTHRRCPYRRLQSASQCAESPLRKTVTFDTTTPRPRTAQS